MTSTASTLTPLAMRSRAVPLRPQRPRQLNTSTLSGMKCNVDMDRICRNDNFDAASIPQMSAQPIHYLQNQLSLDDMEVRSYVLKLLEDLESNINNDNYGNGTHNLIINICVYLKQHGSRLEEDNTFKEQIDTYFNLLRNILRNSKLSRLSRAYILEVIELRASNWRSNDDLNIYYQTKIGELEANESFSASCDLMGGLKQSQSSGSLISSSPVGHDIVKSSGKFMRPTKVPGKTFLKDEVVIRNNDSGKVTPGAKERLVQITGPTEDNIERAKELIESTIKRNASPVPFECSTNQTYDNMSNDISNNKIDNDLSGVVFETHSLDNNDNLCFDVERKIPFSFSLNIGGEVIEISTTNFNTGIKAKLLLEKYMSDEKPLELNRYESSDSNSDENNKDDTQAATLLLSQNYHLNNESVKVVKDNSLDQLQRQCSALAIDDTNNEKSELKKSQSQNSVPIGHTSMRFLNTIKHEMPIITYDRDFLLRCAQSPLSRLTPSSLTQIAKKLPNIIRNNNSLQHSHSQSSIPTNNESSSKISSSLPTNTEYWSGLVNT